MWRFIRKMYWYLLWGLGRGYAKQWACGDEFVKLWCKSWIRMTPSPILTSKFFAKKAALPTRSKSSSWCCPSNIEISANVQHLSSAAAPDTSLPIILPSSLPRALPCFPPVFTRRTNGHCRHTLRAVNVFVSLRNNNKCNAFHSFPPPTPPPPPSQSGGTEFLFRGRGKWVWTLTIKWVELCLLSSYRPCGTDRQDVISFLSFLHFS
jgi:hypothetical protein